MLQAEFLRLERRFPLPEVEGLRLTFTIRLTNIDDEATLSIWRTDGELYASSSKTPKRLYIGHIRGSSCKLNPKNTVEYPVHADLSYDVIERLEALRSGGRLRFELILEPVFTIQTRDFLHVSSKLASASFTSYTVQQITTQQMPENVVMASLTIRVWDLKSGSTLIELSVDDWLDILSLLGFKRVRVLEVPAIPVSEDLHIKTALENLDKAWRLMSENYEESLNSCRKALEEIKSYMKEHGLIDEKGEIDFVKIYSGENFGEAVDNIFCGLWRLSDVGSHAGRSKLTSRADMEFTITSIYMLLKSLLTVLSS